MLHEAGSPLVCVVTGRKKVPNRRLSSTHRLKGKMTWTSTWQDIKCPESETRHRLRRSKTRLCSLHVRVSELFL